MNVIEIQQLVKGSQNLDRMKGEINMVVKMLTGIVRQLPSQANIDQDLNCGRCMWMIYYRGMNVPKEIEVRCRVGTMLVYSTVDPDVPFSMEYVQEVHSSLGYFATRMSRMFPDLPDKLEPIFKAAERFP